MYNESTGKRAGRERLARLLAEVPRLARAVAGVWGSRNVWFYDMELFQKTGAGEVGQRKHQETPFHQDTTGIPGKGLHLGNLWIPFEDVPKAQCLAIVKGSHLGPLHATVGVGMVGTESPRGRKEGLDAKKKSEQPQDKKMAGETKEENIWFKKNAAQFPKPEKKELKIARPETKAAKPAILPDNATMRADPERFPLCTWEMQRGDVVMLHPGSIHGGGGVSKEHPARHTLVLRFFGDDCQYNVKDLPFTGRMSLYDGGGPAPGPENPAQQGDHLSYSGGYLHLLGSGGLLPRAQAKL